MNRYVENGDVSSGYCFIKGYTLSEANKVSSLGSTKKRDGNVPNVSGMEDTVLYDDVGIDGIFPALTLHQYSIMEFNNE